MSSGAEAFVASWQPQAAARVVLRAATRESVAFIEVTEENQATTAGVMAGITGFLLGGLWAAVPLFVAGSYMSRRDNDLAVALSGTAKAVLQTLNFLHVLDKKYSVTESFGSQLAAAVDLGKRNLSTETAAGLFRYLGDAILSFGKDREHNKESCTFPIELKGALGGKDKAQELKNVESFGEHLSFALGTEIELREADHPLRSTEPVPSKIANQVQKGVPKSTPTRSGSLRQKQLFLDFQDLAVSEPLSDYYAQQLSPCVEALSNDGVGILPLGMEHAIVAGLLSKRGIERLYSLTGTEHSRIMPLMLLCSDIAMASTYCDIQRLPRRWYVLMKSLLPGPFAFILPATKSMPRAALDHKLHRRLWKRREISLCVPQSGVVQQVISDLGEPLLASTVFHPQDTWEAQISKLNFFVDGGHLEESWSELEPELRVSTVVDLTLQVPARGAGNRLSMWHNQFSQREVPKLHCRLSFGRGQAMLQHSSVDAEQ